MKTIIFIDGENFIYQVRDMMMKRRVIRNRDELAGYDIRALIAKILPEVDASQVKIYYYAAKIHLTDKTDELKERTETIKSWNDRLRGELDRQKIEYVEAGHLLVRDGKKCPQCGHQEPTLTEKGVDVQLATDLIRASGDNVTLGLLSSDGDLMPAVIESKRRGARVIYLGFRGVSNATLARAADKKVTINVREVESVLHSSRRQSDSDNSDVKSKNNTRQTVKKSPKSADELSALEVLASELGRGRGRKK